jgi:hypothetical protein
MSTCQPGSLLTSHTYRTHSKPHTLHYALPPTCNVELLGVDVVVKAVENVDGHCGGDNPCVLRWGFFVVVAATGAVDETEAGANPSHTCSVMYSDSLSMS